MRAEIERGQSGWWWWAICGEALPIVAGRCLSLQEAKHQAQNMAELHRPGKAKR